MKDYGIGEAVVFEDEFGKLKEGVIACTDVYGNPGQYGVEDGEGCGLYSRNADEIVTPSDEEQDAFPMQSDDEYYVYPIM